MGQEWGGWEKNVWLSSTLQSWSEQYCEWWTAALAELSTVVQAHYSIPIRDIYHLVTMLMEQYFKVAKKYLASSILGMGEFILIKWKLLWMFPRPVTEPKPNAHPSFFRPKSLCFASRATMYQLSKVPNAVVGGHGIRAWPEWNRLFGNFSIPFHLQTSLLGFLPVVKPWWGCNLLSGQKKQSVSNKAWYIHLGIAGFETQHKFTVRLILGNVNQQNTAQLKK